MLTNVSNRTLESINSFMAAEAEQKWHQRLLRKSMIEEGLARFHAELDDATRMFQVCSYFSYVNLTLCTQN